MTWRHAHRAVFVLLVAAAVLAPASLRAQTAGASCSIAGYAIQQATGNTVYCYNNTTWDYPAYQFGTATANSGNCASGYAGEVQWTGTVLKVCDGSNWDTLSTSAGFGAAGSPGYVQYNSGGVLTGSASFFWNGSGNGQLGLGTETIGTNAVLAVNGGMTLGTYAAIGTAAPANGLIVSGTVGIGTALPNGTAILDIESTTKGLLPPQLSTTQRNAITLPATGLTIYNTNNLELETYDGSNGWEAVGAYASDAAGLTGQVQFNLNSSNELGASPSFFWNNSGGGQLGIGTTALSLSDAVSETRPLTIAASDSSTTEGGSAATLVISNLNTTTGNTSALAFAALTGGGSTSNFADAEIVSIHGARTTGEYPAGQLAFMVSPSLNVAPAEEMRITGSGVGIGSAAPEQLLTVAGNIDATGTNGYITEIANDTTTGTTANKLAKLTTELCWG
jgi:hypothetical protein